MAHLVAELGLSDYAFYAWDARGHGLSDGSRGDCPDVATAVRDLDVWARHIARQDGIALADMSVIAQSVGAVIAAAWVHVYAPPLKALVLASPAFNVRLWVPFAKPCLRALRALRGKFFVKSYVKSALLTNDPERCASYKADPLVTRPISVDMLLDLAKVSDKLVADAAAINCPVQLLISEDDYVVSQAPQHEFFNSLSSAIKERHVLTGFRHDTLGEKDRAHVLARVHRFIEDQFSVEHTSERTTTLLSADRSGPYRMEYDRLSTPLPSWSLQSAWWRLQRWSIRIGSHFSRGMDIGCRAGFDSGASLDHVYRNQPSAKALGAFGRVIDKTYINAIGWRGIRQRKRNIEDLLCLAMDRLKAEGEQVAMADIAAGQGAYVVDAITGREDEFARLTLRDLCKNNIDAGQQKLRKLGLCASVFRFEQGDAFDVHQLAQLGPDLNLGVVSGLYELFPDNAPLRSSLQGLAQAILPGGYLIYTNQPWHPQLEFIARALTSHRDGQPWVMRRRSQAEMDALVSEAGFEKIEQRIDRWGIFSVSLAVRRQ
ncbi:MAG: bifunctional alpha/beta hydrolase/class I SAM-dependent methyltransferase [Alphaproteobacteria bacterium]